VVGPAMAVLPRALQVLLLAAASTCLFLSSTAQANLLNVADDEEDEQDRTSMLDVALEAVGTMDEENEYNLRHHANSQKGLNHRQNLAQLAAQPDGQAKEKQVTMPSKPMGASINIDLDSPEYSEKRKMASFLGLILLLAVTIMFFCFIVFGDTNAEALEDKADELKELEWSYMVIMKDMEKKVQALCDMQVDWSQHMFNAKKNDFVEFLLRLQANPERFGGCGDDILEPMRNLVKAWLALFRECSMDPVTNPCRPVEDYEIDYCTSVKALCNFVSQKLEPFEVEFVDLPKASGNRRGSVWQVDQELQNKKEIRQEFMDRAKKARELGLCSWVNFAELNPLYLTHTIERHQNSRKNRGCCSFPKEFSIGHKQYKAVRINFLTCKHLMLFILFVKLHLLAFYLLLIRGHVGFLVMVISCALMWVIMWKFEVFDLAAKIRIMALEIHAQKDEMLAKGKEIEGLIGRIDRPSQIWIHRTRPALDVMSGLCRKISVTKWADSVTLKDFIDTALAGSEELRKGLGSTAEFSVVSDDLMKCVRLQLETTANFISQNTARDIKGELVERMMIPRLLVVRVLNCKDLPKGTWVDNYDPYVRLRCREDAKWLQTDARANNPNPKWHTSTSNCEFRFLLNGPETQLFVEVMDENTVGSDTFIGSVQIGLSELEGGGWKTFTKVLPDAWQGSVSLECMLATDMASLVQLFPEPAGNRRHSVHDYEVDEEDLEELEARRHSTIKKQ